MQGSLSVRNAGDIGGIGIGIGIGRDRSRAGAAHRESRAESY
jgi:hypothetical protein